MCAFLNVSKIVMLVSRETKKQRKAEKLISKERQILRKPVQQESVFFLVSLLHNNRQSCHGSSCPSMYSLTYMQIFEGFVGLNQWGTSKILIPAHKLRNRCECRISKADLKCLTGKLFHGSIQNILAYLLKQSAQSVYSCILHGKVNQIFLLFLLKTF